MLNKLYSTLGILIGLGILWGVTGPAYAGDSYLEFDGVDDYVNCGAPESLNISGTTITLEAWVYPTAFGVNYYDHTLVAKEGSNTHGYGLRYGGAGKVSFYASEGWDGNEVVSPDNVIGLNGWSHIAGTYDGASMKLYINGALVAETFTAHAISPTDGILCIGKSNTWTRLAAGRIDEVRIWDITRSQAEINGNKDTELAGNEAGLAACYKMNEGNGAILNDTTENATVGILMNGPTWGAGVPFSLYFDGVDDYGVKNPTTGLPSGNSAYSWEAWVNAATPAGANRKIFSWGDDSDNSSVQVGFAPSGFLVINHWGAPGDWTTSYQMPPNEWVHLAGTYDGDGGEKLYVNGVLADTRANLPGLNVPVGAELRIGDLVTGAYNQFFHGFIRDFRIWDMVRSENDINLSKNVVLVGNEAGLVAYYKMNEGAEATINDTTLNHNHATLFGPVWGVQNFFAPPSLTTTEISGITAFSSISGGAIISDGGVQVTSIGICWNTTGDPTIADRKTTDESESEAFSSTLTELSPNTTYYVRAYATNSVGTAYGDELSFTTLTTTPSLITAFPSRVTNNSAQGGGSISSDGGSPVTERGVCWNTTGWPTTANPTTSNGTGTGSFTSHLTGLLSGVTYYIRAYAANSRGTVYGVQYSFTTLSVAWPTAFSITYGQTLGDVTLTGGTVTQGGVPLAGTFSFLSPSTKPSVGEIPYPVIFTPANNDTYYTLINDIRVTVTPKLITITAENLTKTYGEPLTIETTAFSITSGVLESGDTISHVTLESAGIPGRAAAGSYPIIARMAVGQGVDNYLITYENGVLIVNPKPITLTANNREKNFGAQLNLGSVEFSITGGLEISDTITGVTLTSTGAARKASAGLYAITPANAQGAALKNYEISYVAGTLTVSKATPVVTVWPTASALTYGESLSQALLTGGKVSVPGTFAFDAPDTIPETGITDHPITFTPTRAVNYTTVTGKAPVAVTLPSYTLTIGKTGTGQGTIISSPSGISCGDVCTCDFPKGTTVTLHAVPDSGSTFSGWLFDHTESADTLTVTMIENQSISAEFSVASSSAFILTSEGLERLKERGVPAMIIDQLGDLIDTAYTNSEALIDALTEKIGEDQANHYKFLFFRETAIQSDINYALDFTEREGVVEVKDNAPLTLTGIGSSIRDALTLEVWIFFNGDPVNWNIISKTNGFMDNGYSIHTDQEGDLIYTVWNSQGTPTHLNMGRAPLDGAWHHLAMTWRKGDQFTGYVDGFPLQSIHAGVESVGVNSFSLFIGGAITAEGLSGGFDGKIDEVRIWSRDLDQETIQCWRYKEITIDHPYYDNLIAYYPMNMNSGQIVYDAKGQNDGIIIGSIGWEADVFTTVLNSLVLKETRLMPHHGTIPPGFGKSVSISYDYAAVGAPMDEKGGPGAVYIFKRDGVNWIQEAILTPSDGAANDHFGKSIAISGNRIIVGSYKNDGLGQNAGAAYIFERTQSGWTEQAKLTAADGVAGGYFGSAVAISSSGAAVSARSAISGKGSIYIFTAQEGLWTQQARLTSDSGKSQDAFGESLAMNDTCLISGDSLNNEKGTGAGAVHVFELHSGTWERSALLFADDANAYAGLGVSVSLSGKTIITGAYGDDEKGPYAGAAYIFEASEGIWRQRVKLTPIDGSSFDSFGMAVALSGKFAAVGAPMDDYNGQGSGSLYLYEYHLGEWLLQNKLSADLTKAYDGFGKSLSLSNSDCLIGAAMSGDTRHRSNSPASIFSQAQ